MATMTHDEFVQKYGRPPTAAPANVNSAPQQAPQPTGILDKIGNVAQGVANFVGAKGITQEYGADIASALAPKDQQKYIEHPSLKTVTGSAIQTGANLIPGLGEGGLLAKTAVGAGTGLTFDVGNDLQNNQPIKPGVGTVVGAGIPLAGAAIRPVTAIVGRLLKGVGGGLAGVSSKTLDQIIQNPQAAKKASQIISQNGTDHVLTDNAKTIVNGISKVRQEARASFGNALADLKATDINPATFRQSIQPVLDKFGVSSKGGTRTLANVEFEDPKNIQKASDLVSRVNSIASGDMNGASLRKLADDIESAKYKTATSDERLSFNAFLNDLSSGVKDAVNNSTDKLKEVNAAFSTDMQLAETMQNVFGKVKFNNLPEVVKASQQLETLFAKKGLAPQQIDRFLTRIGVHPADFNTSEAVRQIASKGDSANAIGLSPGELTREATSAVISPNLVKNLAIIAGTTEQALAPFLQTLKTPIRNLVIEALLQGNQDTQQQ